MAYNVSFNSQANFAEPFCRHSFRLFVWWFSPLLSFIEDLSQKIFTAKAVYT